MFSTGSSPRPGLHTPKYIYDSQMVSKFTDPREVLLTGSQAQHPADVVIAEQHLAEAEEFGTEAEILQQRRKLARRMHAALARIDAELLTISQSTTADQNNRAFLTRRRELLRARLTALLRFLLAK
jgi:hypothetical protein